MPSGHSVCSIVQFRHLRRVCCASGPHPASIRPYCTDTQRNSSLQAAGVEIAHVSLCLPLCVHTTVCRKRDQWDWLLQWTTSAVKCIYKLKYNWLTLTVTSITLTEFRLLWTSQIWIIMLLTPVPSQYVAQAEWWSPPSFSPYSLCVSILCKSCQNNVFEYVYLIFSNGKKL